MSNIFDRLKIKFKLMIAPGIVLLFFLFFGGFTYNALYNQKTLLDEIYNTRFQRYLDTAEILTDVTKVHGSLYRMLSWVSANFDNEKIKNLGEDQKKTIENVITKISNLILTQKLSKEENELYKNSFSLLTEYKDWAYRVIGMSLSDISIATMFMGTTDAKYQLLEKELDQLKEYEKSNCKVSYSSSINNFSLLLKILVTIFILSFIISTLIIVYMTRHISNPIKSLTISFKDISEGRGDLSKDIQIKSKDETGELAMNFNIFLDKLNQDMFSLKKKALKFNETAENMTNTSSQLALSSEQQASSTEEMYSTMEEFTITLDYIKENILKQNEIINMTMSLIEKLSNGVNSIVNNTQQIKEKMNENIKSSEIGEEKINQSVKETINMNNNIKEIALKIKKAGEQSENIDGILKIIENIAEQTNMLAMNAAIEAAHAGNAGGGFAIVASEVRKLAENTAHSVQDISQLIGNIKSSINEAVAITEKGGKIAEEGIKLSNESINALDEIMKNIQNSHSMILEIAKISDGQGKAAIDVIQSSEKLRHFSDEIKVSIEEQTKAAGQIIETVGNISKATEDNARSADDLANMAKSMQTENNELVFIVNKFKLKENEM